MQRTVTTWDELTRSWDGVMNFMMAGECAPFSFTMPPIEQVIDTVRRDDEVQVSPGDKGAVVHFRFSKIRQCWVYVTQKFRTGP